ncbi:UDP-2,3-diacylglucosamine diphosphatase [Rhodoferax aquaticus]|uniref:UDP-2,3-diacylglucosamine hydrolase n=1 Tax=Rhodoferax aquaticus TaxID=2527691 RepID=A0A515EVR2_9BURK|nr:UDP-2,3-diacylglucosamine diphosphatase [Rhodoferax aquaticus]QDL56736.1 UDP-2,3-diacylglucosamine diphosphatase [Rhodoferax aquaticus]
MEIHAPDHWRCVEFISDLHLHASEPKTFRAWEHYLNTTQADAIFILGDLFEVWVGDDVLDNASSFEAMCTRRLRSCTQNSVVHVMHGNRDFLLGQGFANASGTRLISDPCTLVFGMQRWALSHGDALCLDDHAYMQFRAMVRSPDWQTSFLSQPLDQRIELASNMRAKSEALKQKGTVYADVDTEAALGLMVQMNTPTLIHGHTHKPATHQLDHEHQRIVLSDWDLSVTPARAQLLRLQLATSTPHALAAERVTVTP